MKKFTDIRIGKRLALAAGASILQLVCVAGVSLWALGSGISAGKMAQTYAYKLNLAEKLDATLAEVALRMTTLAGGRQMAMEEERVLAPLKQYVDGLAGSER